MAIFISIDLTDSTSFERIYNVESRIINMYRTTIKSIEDCISSTKLHGKFVFNHFKNLGSNQICFVASNHLCLFLAIFPELFILRGKTENGEIISLYGRHFLHGFRSPPTCTKTCNKTSFIFLQICKDVKQGKAMTVFFILFSVFDPTKHTFQNKIVWQTVFRNYFQIIFKETAHSSRNTKKFRKLSLHKTLIRSKRAFSLFKLFIVLVSKNTKK